MGSEEGFLGFAPLLGLVAMGGGFGGLLEVLSECEREDGCLYHKSSHVRPFDVVVLIVIGIILGVGGGLGAQFALSVIGTFSNQASIDNMVYIVTLSMVAGFGGRRLLPRLYNSLEEQMDQMKKQNQEVRDEARESSTISLALTALMQGTTERERRDLIPRVLELTRRDPRNRQATIVAARLMRSVEDYKSAISTLSDFVSLKRDAEEYDKDLADVLYNRACYWSLLYRETKDEGHAGNAVSDLESSIEISPANAEDAPTDDDFISIRDTPEFKRVVRA